MRKKEEVTKRQGIEGGIEKGQWGSEGGRYALGKMKLCFRADKKLRRFWESERKQGFKGLPTGG